MSACARLCPYILCGFAEAKKGGAPALAIATTYEKGGGKIIITINEPEELLRDIALVAGIDFEPTKAQTLDYKAQRFLSSFGKDAA